MSFGALRACRSRPGLDLEDGRRLHGANRFERRPANRISGHGDYVARPQRRCTKAGEQVGGHASERRRTTNPTANGDVTAHAAAGSSD